jgi:hypothetical protein
VKRPDSATGWFNVAIGLAVIVFCLVLGIITLIHGIHRHNSGTIVGGAILTALGAIAPAIGVYAVVQKAARSTVPALKPPKIALTIEKSGFAPGDAVAGRVDIVEAGHVRSLDVSLACHDRTSDYEGVSFMGAASTLAQGELAPPASYAFSVTIPADAPVTYGGNGARIWWVLDARCNVLGTDEHASQEITVRVPAARVQV